VFSWFVCSFVRLFVRSFVRSCFLHGGPFSSDHKLPTSGNRGHQVHLPPPPQVTMAPPFLHFAVGTLEHTEQVRHACKCQAYSMVDAACFSAQAYKRPQDCDRCSLLALQLSHEVSSKAVQMQAGFVRSCLLHGGPFSSDHKLPTSGNRGHQVHLPPPPSNHSATIPSLCSESLRPH
jgi:hypothetical protein